MCRFPTTAALLLASSWLYGCGPEAPAPAPERAEPSPTSASRPGETFAAVDPSGETRRESVAGLDFDVPVEWVSRPSTSPMRLAEILWPGPAGEATLVLFQFPGGAGSVEQNIERWRSQFEPPAEGAGEDHSATEMIAVPPLEVTLVDIRGTYVAPVRPGLPETYNEPNSRMLGAIVQGAGDPVYFRAVGPVETVSLWEPAFRATVGSLAPSDSASR